MSILVVLFYHYRPTEFFFFGLYGVMLFFMISGFCIAASLEKTSSLVKFVVDRWRRLVPALIVCALITTVVEKTFPEARPDRLHGWQEFFSSTVCMPTLYVPCSILGKLGVYVSRSFVDGAYWSLVYEFQFYFFLAAVYFLLSRKYFAEVFAASTFILVLISALNLRPVPEVVLYFPQFLVGISFYKIVRKQNQSALICLIGTILSTASMWFWGQNSSSMPVTNPLGLTAFAICSLLLATGVLTNFKWKKIVPMRQILVLYGIISYPLYLLHQDIGLVILELEPFLNSTASKAVIVPAIVTVAAYLVHRFVEYAAQPKKRPNWRLEW